MPLALVHVCIHVLDREEVGVSSPALGTALRLQNNHTRAGGTPRLSLPVQYPGRLEYTACTENPFSAVLHEMLYRNDAVVSTL